MAKIEDRVAELVKDKIENIGYNLYDVEYAKEGPNYFLRIYIDSPKGIDLDDCEKVSNEINEILDEADYIKEQYFLEVSSQVEAKFFRKDENKNKSDLGELKEFDSETGTIDETKIERKNIAQLKTVYEW